MNGKSLILSFFLSCLILCSPACTGGTGEPDPIPDPIEKPDPTPDPEPEPEPSIKEEADDPATDPKGVFDYASLKSLGHPRLLMNAQDFADLKTKVTSERFTHQNLYMLHALVMNQANEATTSSTQIEYKLDAAGKRLLDQSRLALLRLASCAYAYRITGNNKYLQRADSDLKKVCSFQDWHPSHYLDVGEMALGVAIAYDWLYADLSYETRVMARKALSNFALKTSVGQGFHTMMSNWNQVCNAGVIAAALAVYEKDKKSSAQVIETGVADNAVAMKSIYSPDGNYAEGYDYWDYGTSYEAIIISLLEKCFGNCNGLDKIDGFSKTPGYMLFMAGSCGGVFGYADGGVSSERVKMGMWWFAARQKDSSLLLNEKRLVDAGLYKNMQNRLTPLMVCMIKDFDGLDNTDGAAPAKNIWHGEGPVPVVMVHTGWKYDKDDIYLGIKGGPANHSHGHMDAGSFVFDQNAGRWSDDLPRPSYATIENACKSAGGNFWSYTQKSLRWDVFRMNNLCHSTISIMNSDGSVSKLHPSDHIPGGSAKIVEVYEQDNKLGAKLNMTDVLKDGVASEYRTITLVDGKDLVVIDEVKAKPGMEAQVRWQMLSKCIGTPNGQKMDMVLSGRNMYMTVESSDPSVVPQCEVFGNAVRPSTWTARTWDPDNTGYFLVGYTATVPAGKTVTFKATLSPDKQ